MTISNIQKKKFLDNIYRLMYSSGLSETDKVIRQPDEREVKAEFDSYFSSNRLGQPLINDINLLRNSVYTDADLMNLFMAKSLLNMEVLYDSVHENNEDLMKVTTVLNRRLEFLKQKRVYLEKKIDDLLFANSNTDGYFYSFSESFANLNNVDIGLSTCFVDIENKKAVLPTLKSSVLDFRAPGKINLSNIKYDLVFNGATVVSNASLPNANNIFDGLNDTTSMVGYSAPNLGVCAMVINIPLNTPFIVSKIEGKINTSSSVVTTVEIIDNANATKSQYRRKQSNSSYDRFSFDFEPQSSGIIRITFVKYQPDITNLTRTNDRYTFNFELKEILVSGQYYDKEASLISKPIGINAGNDYKVIDAVSIEATNASVNNGDIRFFIAEDVSGATNISDFDWKPISSTNDPNSGFDKVISFDASTKNIRAIKSEAEEQDIQLLPLVSTGALNELNPSNSIYSGIRTYRVGVIDQKDIPYNPYILDSVNRISFKYVSYTEGLYKDLNKWSSIVNLTDKNLQLIEMSNKEITNIPSIAFSGNLNTGISAFLETNLLCEESSQVNHSISKSGEAIDWSVAVYLNGIKIVDLPSGEITKDITWNLLKGINKISIAFDSIEGSSGSISLMDGVSISKYGTPFLNYYSYVDPFDFKINRSENDLVFTVDKYFGRKEILCRKEIKDNSRIVYYSNNLNQIEKIRFRADFTRYGNAFGTPALDDYRIKFKNSINGLV